MYRFIARAFTTAIVAAVMLVSAGPLLAAGQGSFATVLAAGASTAPKAGGPAIDASVGGNAAAWLMAQQFANGSFPWTLGGSAPANTQGATALALLRLYEKNGDPALLAAARRNGDCRLAGAACIAGFVFGDGNPRFSTHDPLFLQRLSQATGVAAYNDLVSSGFWGRLDAGTYGATASFDLDGYIASVVAARASIPELSAWDFSKLAIAAHEAGRAADTATLMAAINASLEQGGPGSGNTTYDELALAGAIWASASTGIELDPAAGGWAAANSTSDLAALLAGLQIGAGPNSGAFSDTSTGVAGGSSDGPNVQATAYALFALGAVNPTAYAGNIASGYAYIRAQQQPNGQILVFDGAPANYPGGIEVHGEGLESYALGAYSPDRYVSAIGFDSGDCTNPAARCRTLAYAIGQADGYDIIHVAAGTYEVGAPVMVNKPGLAFVGDNPLDKPVFTRNALFGGTPNQPLLVVAGVRDVRIEGLDFAVNQTYTAEAIQAYGIVDGLVVRGNGFLATSNGGTLAGFGRRNAISINLVNRMNGSFVRVEDNVVDGTNAAVPGSTLFRAGVAMDAGVGVIRGNTITAQSHDVIVRFATTTANSSGSGVLVENNALRFGGISFMAPNANAGSLAILNNVISAPAYADQFPDAGDFALGRIISNGSGLPLTITNNTFSGHANYFRGLLIENVPGVTLQGNTFTPAAGATQFASLVLSNKELTTDNPPAVPRTLGLVARGNTFNGSGVAGAGTAVMLINDNDAGGTASYGSLLFGGAGPGEANAFDDDLRWYYYLRQETCSTNTSTVGTLPGPVTPGGTNPLCTHLGYNAISTPNGLPNTEVRPFAGNVAATGNLYGGAAPGAANIGAILARTHDVGANPALGTVDYGFAASEAQVFVDDDFAGHLYGDVLAFNHGATGPRTVYFGIDAFATLADGLMHVEDAGQVFVARGSYSGATINREVQLIGDGNADTDPLNSTVVGSGITIAASGSSAAAPLLLRDLRVSGVAGVGISLSGSQSHITLDRVVSSNNTGDGLHAIGPSTTQFLTITDSRFEDNGRFPPLLDGDLAAGFNFGESASALDVVISGSHFNGNSGAGLVVNHIGSASSVSTIERWTITNSEFSRNIPLDPTPIDDPNGYYNGGGGLWLKTGAAGSVIADVTVANSTFADNGTGRTNTFPSLPPRMLNANGISLRARPNTTLTGVRLCDNTFSETPTPGTQRYGINIFDDTVATNNGYGAVEICGVTTLDNLEEGISGFEQFALRGNRPLVNLAGSFVVNGGGDAWQYITLTSAQAVVHVDDDFAANDYGDTVVFNHPQLPATNVTVGDNAFATISEALARVQSGGTVYVAAGLYAESTAAGLNLRISAPVTVLGAQAGVNTGVGGSRDGSDPASESVLVPALATAGLNLDSTAGNPVVRIVSSDVVFDGFLVDGDNAALTSPVDLNGANPDTSTGMYAVGNRITVQNVILRNLVYSGITAYSSGDATGDNAIRNNRFMNITTPSLWGIGMTLQNNFYAEVTGNFMDEVRVGIQTNANTLAAPNGFAPSISNNEIVATRTGIFYNTMYAGSAHYTISANTLSASSNPGQDDTWRGLWVSAFATGNGVTVIGNNVDGSALASSGRTRVGYFLNNVTSSAASTIAIDGGQVSNVDIGVLATDATQYNGRVDDFIVRNVAFDAIAIGALYVEDASEIAGTAKLTIGTGNTFGAGATHQLVLSGSAPAVGFAGGSVDDVYVRSARGYLHAIPGSGPCAASGCTVANASINQAIAIVAAGGTVGVEDGTFAENVVADKSVHLHGPHHGTPGMDTSRGTAEAILSPASGHALFVRANFVDFDGFTIENVNDSAIVSGYNYGGAVGVSDSVSILNNRILDVHAGSGIMTIGPSTNPNSNWIVASNLVRNIEAANGSGINLLSVVGGSITGNHVEQSAFGGIQTIYGTDVDISNNTITGTAHNGINVARSTGVDVGFNTIVDANTSATADEAGITLYGGSTTVAFYCNTVSGSGSNGFSTAAGINEPLADVQVFHNAITVASSLSHNLPTNLAIGSNWYAGTPSTGGANAAGLQVANALGADPTANPALCGNNAPTDLVAVSGSGQATPIGAPFAQPLVLRLQDALGGAVAGAAVTLTPPGPGASAILGTPAGTTDHDGRFSSSASANGFAGTYLVGADSGALHADFSLTNEPGVGTVVFDNLALTYTGSAQALLAHLVEDPAAVCVVSPASVTNAGSYPVSATCTGANHVGSGTATAVVAKAVGTLAFDSPLTYTGVMQAATAQITEEPATSCTVAPATVGPDAGSHAVSASCVGTNYDASGIGVIVIDKAPSTVTINPADLQQDFGATHAVAASASPTSVGGFVEVTYDGSASVPTAVGTYAVLATLVDPNYTGSANAVLTIGDAANVELGVLASQAMALIGDDAPFTDYISYSGTVRNSGEPTGQNVHTVISVVRIDDGNTTGANPIAIDAADVEVCLYDPSGWAAQDPDDHYGCPQDYQSLVYSQGSGAFNGRPAATFRYPVNPINDVPLPTIDPAVPVPPALLRFKRGDYQVHVSIVGSDGTVYATASDGTTVPDVTIAYAGATSGQAEDALLSQTTLRNSGGRVDENVLVRVTLSDAASSDVAPIPLFAADVEFAYQLGADYQTLTWLDSAADGGLVTYFGPGSGFALEDGHDATTAGRGIFHREGSYRLSYEVVDAATLTTVYASSTTAPLTIGPNLVNFALSDLAQVFDGTPRAVTVTPGSVPHTVVYEPLVAASCPATPVGTNTIAPTDAGSYCVYVSATGNYVGSAQGLLVVAKAEAAVSLVDDDGTVDGTVNRTFSGFAEVVDATSTPAVASIVVTYNGDTTAPTATGTYGVLASVLDPNYTGSATGTLIIAANGGATIVLDAGTLAATWDGNPHAVTATTTPAGIAHSVTYVGDGATFYPLSTTPPSAVGQYHVVATTTDANYAPVSAAGMLVITSAGAGIVLDPATLNVTWDGSSHAVTATTTPAGLAYAVTYDGGLDAPSAAGSYAVTATITDANHAPTSVNGTLVISAAGATISLDAGTLAAVFDGQPHAVTATTTPAGLAYQVIYDGNLDAPSAAGSYAVTATITDANHASATASGTLVISAANAMITLDAGTLAAIYDGQPHVVTATTTPAALAYSLSYAGSATPPVSAGSYPVVATITAAGYSGSANGILVIAKATGVVSFSATSAVFDGNPHVVSAVISQEPGNAAACTLTASSGEYPRTNAGSTSVDAVCAGTNHDASGSATLTVAPKPVAIVLAGLGSFTYDANPHAASASVTGVVAGFPAATVVSYNPGGAVAPVAVGLYEVLASLDAASSNYTAAPASGTINITAASATLTLGGLSQVHDGTPRIVTVTTSPAGLATSVTYDGSTTPPSDAGTYTVLATITEAGYSGSASGTLVVARAAATLSLSNTTQVFDGTPKSVTVTTTPAGLATSVTYDGNVAPPSAVGSYAVVASVTDPNHTGSVSGIFEIVAADAPDLAVTITDNRSHVQYDKLLTYVVTVNNLGNTAVSAADVSMTMPAELDVATATWTCIAIGTSTCTAAGTGSLDDTVSMPVGGSLVYLATARVIDSALPLLEEVTSTVVVAATGDVDTANDTASDTTRIVLFRNGFDANGDGAQAVDPETASEAGDLDESGLLMLDLSASWRGDHVLGSVLAGHAANGAAFRIEAVRVDGTWHLRLVASDRDGERASAWSSIAGGESRVMLALVRQGPGQASLLLAGTVDDLEIGIAADARFTARKPVDPMSVN